MHKIDMAVAVSSVLIIFAFAWYANGFSLFRNGDTWDGRGSNPGQFEEPTAIAVDNTGSVYVTDWGNDRVQKFDGEGHFILQWGARGSNPGQFNSPIGIVTDGHGNVYVTEYFGDRLQKFDTSGKLLSASRGQFSSGQAQSLLDSAEIQYNHAIDAFNSGDFGNALEQANRARSLVDQAYNEEQTYRNNSETFAETGIAVTLLLALTFCVFRHVWPRRRPSERPEGSVGVFIHNVSQVG